MFLLLNPLTRFTFNGDTWKWKIWLLYIHTQTEWYQNDGSITRPFILEILLVPSPPFVKKTVDYQTYISTFKGDFDVDGLGKGWHCTVIEYKLKTLLSWCLSTSLWFHTPFFSIGKVIRSTRTVVDNSNSIYGNTKVTTELRQRSSSDQIRPNRLRRRKDGVDTTYDSNHWNSTHHNRRKCKTSRIKIEDRISYTLVPDLPLQRIVIIFLNLRVPPKRKHELTPTLSYDGKRHKTHLLGFL